MTSCRRAFTLIELMIVVAVMVVIGGLVVVSGFRWNDAERINAAQHGISAAILEARAAALESGVPVSVSMIERDDGSSYLAMSPKRAEAGDEVESEEEPQPTALYELPSKLTIVAVPEENRGLPHETDIGSFEQSYSDSSELSLVLALPDGRALLAVEPWQLDADGSRLEPRLETWTGRLEFLPVQDEELGSPERSAPDDAL